MTTNPTELTTYSGQLHLSPETAHRTPSGRREYECRFITAGRVMRADGEESTWLIPAATLKRSITHFDSVSSYLDHPELFGWGNHQTPSVRDLTGLCLAPRWSDDEQAILGILRLYDEHPQSAGNFLGVLFDQILADKAKGLEIPGIGLSAAFFHNAHLDEDAGLRITDQITFVSSIDTVYQPGAKGYIDRALETLAAQRPPGRTWSGLSTLPQGESTMSAPSTVPIEPEENLDSQKVPAFDAAVAIATLTDQVAKLSGVVTNLTEDATIHDNGPGQTYLYGGRAGIDQVRLAVEALFNGTRPPSDVRPLSGIRELYTLLSGDFEMNGIFQEDRVYLAAVTSTTMANMVANVLNKRVTNLWLTYPKWWQNGVTEQDFNTLQQVRWITLGGVGELPTVAEGAAYTELSWDDLAQRSSFEKKGGYLGLTLEAIDKDDTARIVAAPRSLAQAAWLTLGKSIAEIFTANTNVGPNIYYDDSNQRALFHASNSNLGSTALSPAAWRSTKIAMMKQSELNSAERMGALLRPKHLWVPIDLEDYAVEILGSDGKAGTAENNVNVDAQGEARSARLQAARSRVISVPFWTETDHWAAQADPLLWPTIGIGYRYGRQPELFSVADPKAGLMFTNDTMPIKVRFFFAVGPIDYRGLYKHNV